LVVPGAQLRTVVVGNGTGSVTDPGTPFPVLDGAVWQIGLLPIGSTPAGCRIVGVDPVSTRCPKGRRTARIAKREPDDPRVLPYEHQDAKKNWCISGKVAHLSGHRREALIIASMMEPKHSGPPKETR
jgi:hypothetical protein